MPNLWIILKFHIWRGGHGTCMAQFMNGNLGWRNSSLLVLGVTLHSGFRLLHVAVLVLNVRIRLAQNHHLYTYICIYMFVSCMISFARVMCNFVGSNIWVFYPTQEKQRKYVGFSWWFYMLFALGFLFAKSYLCCWYCGWGVVGGLWIVLIRLKLFNKVLFVRNWMDNCFIGGILEFSAHLYVCWVG